MSWINPLATPFTPAGRVVPTRRRADGAAKEAEDNLILDAVELSQDSDEGHQDQPQSKRQPPRQDPQEQADDTPGLDVRG